MCSLDKSYVFALISTATAAGTGVIFTADLLFSFEFRVMLEDDSSSIMEIGVFVTFFFLQFYAFFFLLHYGR